MVSVKLVWKSDVTGIVAVFPLPVEWNSADIPLRVSEEQDKTHREKEEETEREREREKVHLCSKVWRKVRQSLLLNIFEGTVIYYHSEV